jgi:hypothetical protein
MQGTKSRERGRESMPYLSKKRLLSLFQEKKPI